jgi:hypothetical protein
MKISAVLLPAAFLCLATAQAQTPTKTAAPPSPSALALVEALRLDDVVAQSSAKGARQARTEGLLTAAQFTCVIIPANQWTADIARHFDRTLTPEELAEAVKFLDSRTGRKVVVEAMQLQHAAERGDAKPFFEPPTPTERRQFEKFMKTSAATKMAKDGSFWKIDAVAEIAKKKVARLLAECPKAKG